MTIDQAQDEIIREMGRLDGWMARYEYLIGLGHGLEPIAAEHRVEKNLVGGCQSQVWVHAKLDGARLTLSADSDATIVRGVIALLLRVLDGRPPRDVANADLYFVDRTGLGSSLSPARADGLKSIILRIGELARSLSA